MEEERRAFQTSRTQSGTPRDWFHLCRQKEVQGAGNSCLARLTYNWRFSCTLQILNSRILLVGLILKAKSRSNQASLPHSAFRLCCDYLFFSVNAVWIRQHKMRMCVADGDRGGGGEKTHPPGLCLKCVNELYSLGCSALRPLLFTTHNTQTQAGPGSPFPCILLSPDPR